MRRVGPELLPTSKGKSHRDVYIHYFGVLYAVYLFIIISDQKREREAQRRASVGVC